MGTRDKSDLWQQLGQQYQHLRNSATAYDDGQTGEAARLATTLRVLLHDTKLSTSLLAQLDLKQELEFLDSADHYQGPIVYMHTGLTYLRVGGGSPVFVPKLLGPSPSLIRLGYPLECRADRWASVDTWLKRVVIAEPDGISVSTAAQLIAWMANKDGGAHVAPTLPEQYEALSRKNSLRVHSMPMPWGGGMLSMNDDLAPPGHEAESPVPAAVRQLAFEMMWTLHEHLSEPAPDHRPRIRIAYQK